MPDSVLAFDVGTTSVKAALVAPSGGLRAHAQAPLSVISPEHGHAEQDPAEWWRAVRSTAAELLADHDPATVAGVVFTAQMLGVLPVDAEGEPLCNALIWLDTRSAPQARRITDGFPRVAGYGAWRLWRWLSITGGAPNLAGRDPLSKMLWLREERPELWERTHKLLDVRDHLLQRATGSFLTTYDCANATWLFDTGRGRQRWSPPLLARTGLDEALLPEVRSGVEVAGPLLEGAAKDLGLRAGTPVLTGSGDAAANAVGAGAVRDDAIHLYLGTSALLAAHLPERKADPFAAIGTFCAAERDRYLLIASQETAGASIEWARRILAGGTSHADVAAALELSPPGARGLRFFPWLQGERVPVDQATLRGGFLNLSLEHGPEDLWRAVHEGVALNLRWAWEPFTRLLRQPSRTVRVVGGGARSDGWCQILADVIGRPLERTSLPQLAGVRGAGLLAWAALRGQPLADTADAVDVEQTFAPDPANVALYGRRFREFVDLYKRVLPWYRRIATS